MSISTNFSGIEYLTSPLGKPRAVVIKIEDWDRIAETLSISSSKELMASLKRARAQLSKGEKLLSMEEVLSNL